MEKDINSCDIPIDIIVDAAKGKIKYVHLFIIDGCQAQAFKSAIRNRNLFPHLRAYMELGHLYFTNCYTVFPSVTIPCHASILTGAHPGIHGITGNNWFQQTYDRPDLKSATTGYVKFGTFNNPGLFQHFGKANLDLGGNVKTLFEAFLERYPQGKCASIFEFIYRGIPTKDVIRADFSTLRFLIAGGMWILVKMLFKGEDYVREVALSLDNSAMESTIERIKNHQPELTVTWLPGLDGYSHKFGAKKQPLYMENFAEIDRYFGELINLMKQGGRSENTLVIITSDHGQYDCHRDTDRYTHLITKEDLYTHILNCPINASYMSLPIRLSGKLKIDFDSVNYPIVFAENGGMCHVYVKEIGEPGWWGHPKRFENQFYVSTLESLCTIFSIYRGIDKIFVKGSNGNNIEYFLWDKNMKKSVPLKLDPQKYPAFSKRINSLASTNRSGDILFSAKPGYYFADEKFYGEHGSLSTIDTHVPLLIISPCLKPPDNKELIECDDVVSTTMIAPTIAKTMGFFENLITPIDEKELTKKSREIAQNEFDFLENEINILRGDLGIAYLRRKYSKELVWREMEDISIWRKAMKDKDIFMLSEAEYVNLDREISSLIRGLNKSRAELARYL